MALLKCIECGHDVSEYAQACPHCGCPVNIIKQKQDEYAVTKNVQVSETSSECGSEILCNDSQSCCPDDSVKESEEKIICKVNGVDHDFTQIYSDLMKVSQKKNWNMLSEFSDIVMRVYDLTKLFEPYVLCVEIIQSGRVPQIYNAVTDKEWLSLQREKTPSKPTIRCPYCGSINVKPLGLFDGGWSAVGNNWKCKNCKSYF